jgi:hypothetical protein
MTRSITSGGRRVLWLFYLPAIVIGTYTLGAFVRPIGLSFGLTLGEWDFIWFVVVTFAWYFAVSRIPNARMVRNVRRQLPQPAVIYGVSVRSAVRGSGRAVAIFNGASANVQVASPAGIQLWGGVRDYARPVQSWKWSEVEFLEIPGSVLGRLLWAGTPVQIDGSSYLLTASLFSGPELSTLRMRGTSRIRGVQRIESLRQNGATAPRR